MYDPVPAGAERLFASAVQKMVKRPSKFVPGATAYAEQFQCPVCQHVDEALTEGKTYTCICDLQFQLGVMHVHVWQRTALVA